MEKNSILEKYRQSICIVITFLMVVLAILSCIFPISQYASKFTFSFTPKFTIIISSYNYGHFLPQTLDSILSSTEKDFEVIVVNDGSTDNTAEVIEQYIQKDKRIQAIHQENQGLSIARNNAMKKAKGKYFWFVDADDWIDSNALTQLWETAEKLNLDMLSFYTQPVDEEGNKGGLSWYDKLPGIFKNITGDKVLNGGDLSLGELITYPVTSGKQIYKRAFIEKNRITFPEHTLFEDDVFFFHVIFSNARLSGLHLPLYYKRSHGGSITGHRSKYYDSTVRIAHLIYDRIKNLQSSNEKAKSLFSYYFAGIKGKWNALNEEQKKEFFPELIKMDDWIMSQPQEAFWEGKHSELKEFIEKQKAYAPQFNK